MYRSGNIVPAIEIRRSRCLDYRSFGLILPGDLWWRHPGSFNRRDIFKSWLASRTPDPLLYPNSLKTMLLPRS
jgi:hypothetical protein